MSEYINNSQQRKALLKHMILELHGGEAPEAVQKRLKELLAKIPYNEVVEVEQELIQEGLPEDEILQFCDIHTQVLDGHIDQSGAAEIPAGHPVDTFKKENRELEKVVSAISELLIDASSLTSESLPKYILTLHARYNELMDVDKHYLRKEYLLFPFLEKHGITGPPKVMWGKHDEIREKMKAVIQIVSNPGNLTADDMQTIAAMVCIPALQGVTDMIMKEEEILLPMSMDTLSEQEWYEIYRQTMEFGYCLYDPTIEWIPSDTTIQQTAPLQSNLLQLSTGSFSVDELEAIFKLLPIDITFVDKNDKVKFFSLGPDRIFARNRAILGRDVRMCHTPSSVHVVETILEDFKNGKEQCAAFWIQMQGKFIHIEYYAVRGKDGEYLGTIEFTQDISKLRALEGEQRLLSYAKK
ncbi:MAG TPA: DUF438 domain-containing protein [Bacteroidales bacterium]|nr:DUF438 domain-containing protein [Bacteroidales bacterium]